MNKEDKDLLLLDLCSRLPYGVKVESVFINLDTKEHKSCGIEVFDATSILMIRDGLGEFKPYLFPLSSMTEEQDREFSLLQVNTHKDGFLYVCDCVNMITWLNKNHFDYRGLIEKELAIDCTNLDIY